MDLFFNAVKGQFNSLNLVLFFLLISSFLKWRGWRKTSLTCFIITALLFFLFSTAYLPAYFISRMENTYKPFVYQDYPSTSDTIYIHVLGGGYTAQRGLPASSQLSQVSLGRLCEGIRISNLFQNSVLVVSGHVASGDSSMAWTARQSAVDLGVDSTRIQMLSQPTSTLEEAETFVRAYGSNCNLIVVTDAIHMPRAIKFFKEQGIDPYPAPTNFLIKRDNNPYGFSWLPSIENFLMMDRVIREVMGSLKQKVFR